MGHDRGSVIEGIGDEVVYGIICCLAFIGPMTYIFYLWHQQRMQRQVIHPDSAETVQGARQHLPHRAPPQQEDQQPQQHGQQPNQQPNQQQPQPNMRSRPRDRDMTCPICYETSQFAVETNCGHIFCGNCMITYWNHGRWIGAVRCPVCRQTVTLLLRCFTDEENRLNSAEKDEIVGSVNRYNRRFSGEPRSIMEYLQDLPTLLRHLISEFFSFSGLIIMFRVRVVVLFVLGLLYFISPLDIIPEAAFGLLGLLDDFFVLLLLAIYISIMYRRFVANRGA